MVRGVRRLVENVIWEEGLAENARISVIWKRRSKIAKKITSYDI